MLHFPALFLWGYLVLFIQITDEVEFLLSLDHCDSFNLVSFFFHFNTVKPKKPVITCTGAQGNISSVTIREGDDLECSCSSTGLPPPNVIWELSSGRRNISVLKRTKITRHETNLYTCVAENQYGFKDQSTLDVIVQCKYL